MEQWREIFPATCKSKQGGNPVNFSLFTEFWLGWVSRNGPAVFSKNSAFRSDCSGLASTVSTVSRYGTFRPQIRRAGHTGGEKQSCMSSSCQVSLGVAGHSFRTRRHDKNGFTSLA
eukprot:g77465.t1